MSSRHSRCTLSRLQDKEFHVRISRWLSRTLLIGTFAACGSQYQTSSQPPQAPAPTAQASPHGEMCPMMVDPATTQITTMDTNDGVAITFTTMTSDVNALRTRVHQIADMHNRMAMQQGGCPHAGAMREGMMMVPSRAMAQDIEGGTRVVLVPNDPSQLETLREQARMHADMLQRGECPMMHPSAPAPAPAPEHEQPGSV